MSEEKKKKKVKETVEEPVEQDLPEEKEADGELDRLKKDLAEAQDRILRISAEYDNFKKRTQREKEELYSVAAADVLVKLLPIFDNLERAGMCTDFESLDKGVDMILQSFYATLEMIGVKEVAGIGSEFDPNLHNAVLQEERDDMEENTVCDVLQKGYQYGERLLRPAMVKVAK